MPKKLSVPSPRSSAIQQQQVFAQATNPLSHLKTVDFNRASLEQLGETAKQAHASCLSHLGEALQAALIAGTALITAKQKFVYDRNVGGFRGWITDLGISRSAAYRYINLAQNSEIVSQAETLSEALNLIALHRAEQRELEESKERLNIRRRRTTLKLSISRDAKLEAIANARGIEVSDLVTDILEKWLSRQPDQQQIDIESK